MKDTQEAAVNIFAGLMPARFLSRPNRFVVRCEMGGKKVTVYLPNPGKLRELLLPGAKVMLAENRRDCPLRTRFTCVAVERDGLPVMLHTSRQYGGQVAFGSGSCPESERLQSCQTGGNGRDQQV